MRCRTVLGQSSWQYGCVAAVCSVLSAGCSTSIKPVTTLATPCPVSAPAAPPIRWLGFNDADEAQRRHRWCEPVGPVAAGNAPALESIPRRGDLLIVSWNVAVGAGDVAALVRRLVESERRAGRADPDIVLLLQEAYRAGAGVPDRYSRVAIVPRRIAHGTRQGRDVESLAAALGLHYIYVPSMRNGAGEPGARAEDRGNAILSSLPLSDAAAIELPVEHQRRVAVAATVHAGGLPLRVVSAHLDTRRPFLQGSIFSGPLARRRQAAALIDALASERALTSGIIVGGDFNTLAGTGEPAVRAMEARFARASCGSAVTHQSGLSLDYLFLSDRTMLSGCERWRDRFDSDHHPLIARVAPPEQSDAGENHSQGKARGANIQ